MINYKLFKRNGITEKKDIDKIIQDYKTFNLSWDIESMIFINDNNITSLDVYDGNNFKALLIMIRAGIKENDISKAKEIFDTWQSWGYGFRLLRSLCIDDMENAGFFLGEAEKISLEELQNKKIGQNYILMEVLREMNTILELQRKGRYLKD